MRYGSRETVKTIGDNEVTELELIHEGQAVGDYRKFKSRIIVHGPKEETAAYLRFSSDMKTKRESGLLAILKDDPTTVPAFLVKYPHKDVDGSYLVITTWTEKV